MQSARNYHAMLAARSLGRLSGLLQGRPAASRCEAACAALSALLTPALAAKLASPDPKPLLMHLNSSLLNPQVVLLPLHAHPSTDMDCLSILFSDDLDGPTLYTRCMHHIASRVGCIGNPEGAAMYIKGVHNAGGME